MYKLLQVCEGVNTHEFTVPEATDLNLVVVSVHVLQADVSVRIRLTGRGATASITGVIVGSGQERISLHTMQVHEAPDTTSDLLVKAVLSDHAKCLYDGGIRVEKPAQKTNAYQRNENLLLSGRAYAESKPSLEILANDVRCTHGATAGPVDPEQLWYLASRGISLQAAESLVVDGFIRSALMRIEDSSIIKKLWQILFP